MKNYIISVDLGGTKILSAIIDMQGKILNRFKLATDVSNGKTTLIKGIVEAVNNVLLESGLNESEIKAVSIGVPGSVNPFTGKIGVAPNLNLANFNIRQELQKFISLPVFIENDVNLAALGIQNFELKGKGKNILVVFVGTGIGGALIFDGKLYRGSKFFAGEIGHIQLDKKGPKCGCGHKGCFEAFASRTAIVRDIKKDMKDKKKIKTGVILPVNKPIKSKGLAAAIKKKDPIVTKRVSDACNIIGQTLANISNILNLDMIVLGGGVIEALDKFMLPKIKASFAKTVLVDAAKGLKIIATKLGDDAALYGGIALAEEMESIKN